MLPAAAVVARGLKQRALRVLTTIAKQTPTIIFNPNINHISTNPQTAATASALPLPPQPLPAASRSTAWYFFGGMASAVTVYCVWKYRRELRRLFGPNVRAITHAGHDASGVIVLDASSELDDGKLEQVARKLSEWSSIFNGLEVEVMLEHVDVPSPELLAQRFINLEAIEPKSYDDLYDAQLDALVFRGILPGDELKFWTWVTKNHVGWLLLRLLIGITLTGLLAGESPSEEVVKRLQHIKLLSEAEKQRTTSSKEGDLWQHVLTSVGVLVSGQSLYNVVALRGALDRLDSTKSEPVHDIATASLEGSGKSRKLEGGKKTKRANIGLL